MNDPIFEVERLSLAYPGRRGQRVAPILKDVSFTVERGHALTLVGPSGSGKSSLLRCLNRLEEPTAGTVHFDGRDIRALDPRRLRRGAALVMQTPVVFEGTVRDNLRVRPADVDGDLSEARLGQALADVGLEGELLERDAATLSGGEKQRVTIARALLGDPRALLLDEPTSALDPPNAALVVETVSRLREARGLSIVAVTHQPELVRRLGGMLLYLVKGEMQAYERVGDLDVRLQAFLAGERAAGALFVSTGVTLAYVIGAVVQVRPWYEPQYIIPIAGMILGSSMTSAALGGDRLQGELRVRAAEVETRLALGFSGREAMQPLVRSALRAAMIPVVNGMMTVGLVQLPGMMTGQILAGSSPLLAIRYQIVVVFMQAAATAVGSLLFVRLAAARYLTPAHQLRRWLV